jgi:hypothetical protein
MLLVACLPVRGAGPPRRASNGKLYIEDFVGDVYGSLRAGGAIYECEILEKATAPGAGRDELGSLRLKVAATLYGVEREQIIVPYLHPGHGLYQPL